MKKTLALGALALSATTLFGLVGCDNNQKEPPKYAIIFDHDNNKDTQNIVIEYKKGQSLEDLDFSDVKAYTDPTTGFAVQWDFDFDGYQLENKNLLITARYGDGSQANPYLISDASQLLRVMDQYTRCLGVKYSDTNSVETTDESRATTKYVYYPTVTLKYEREKVSDEWGFKEYKINTVSNQFYNESATGVLAEQSLGHKYFKLINNISFDNIQDQLSNLDLSGRYFSGTIDGNGYTIEVFDSKNLKPTAGALFHNVVGANFKNLNVWLCKNIGSIAHIVRGGYTTTFTNVEVVSTDQNVKINIDDNNESPFANFVLQGATLNFNNCKNNANYVGYANYNGLFVGGYAVEGTNVNFTNCSFTGKMVSRGLVGMFFGNDYKMPSSYTITNCSLGSANQDGEFASIVGKDVNIVVANVNPNKWTEDKALYNIETYNTLQNGNFTIYKLPHQEDELGEHKDPYIPVSTIEYKYLAVINGNSVVLEAGESENIEYRKYVLMLSAYAENEDNGATVLTNIEVELDYSIDKNMFEDCLYGMMDLNTYKAENPTATIPSAGSTEWKYLPGYQIRYFVDKTNAGVYVFDYSQFEQNNGYDEGSMKLDISANSLSKLVICPVIQVIGGEEKVIDIDFVINF